MSDPNLPAAALALRGPAEFSLGVLLTAVFAFLLIVLVVLALRDLLRWFLGVSELKARVRRLEAEVARFRAELGAVGPTAGVVANPAADLPRGPEPEPEPGPARP